MGRLAQQQISPAGWLLGSRARGSTADAEWFVSVAVPVPSQRRVLGPIHAGGGLLALTAR